ncbi:MAG: GDP-mannose 4,6-dehydratase [Eubacterium sp.]|nr:GDP-mannose 4,6-dehydratase [Eubacterium sp.]
MKSLIIGGAGFVGPYLARHLTEIGYDVAATKLREESSAGLNVPVYDLNILDPDAVFELLDQLEPDDIFHLAAQSSVAVSWKNPQITADVNIKGSINVLEAVRRLAKKPRILIAGSGEEYGTLRPEDMPVCESTAVNPVNIYAATKACQNMIAKIYAQAYGVQAVMVRAFNHIGPGQPPVFVVPDFCRQVAWIEAGKQEAVIRVGSLDVRRDFTDVRDIVRAYVLLAKKGKIAETYNVGSGQARAVGDILNMVLANSTADIRVETDAGKLRPADMPVMEADIGKMQQVTGWKPVIGIGQTIREMLDEWRGMVR